MWACDWEEALGLIKQRPYQMSCDIEDNDQTIL